MGERKVIKSCCRSCHGGCGVLVTVEDGVVIRIEGDPESLTRGTICSKGLASIQNTYNPHRLKYPMKRVGERGEGKWQRISWEEALDTIAQKILDSKAKYGPNSVAFGSGTGRGQMQVIYRLCRLSLIHI